ncbi:AMP-binding protein [Methylobacterium dankookense]|uniref:3-methylmercaptopropionyl-CoA ligase n=1 Tax=Methylobacterium dankookense TaxID=560405 RepID=A0A564FU61_9HYPH|nr:AMP-binding protein [Methylobacterium dankookense]GJD57258.1 Long-chain-fatty-acid--CoA ligase [Methylobacterium dankookense]VUF11547.1 Long-chain-fatty-acid--CoA ligase [Methylobacterium dankookense]
MTGPGAIPARAHPFEDGLGRGPANHVALTPASFLARAAAALGENVAVIDGERRLTYAALHARCRRLASALAARGIERLDTVAILAGNTPEMIEAHFAVPMRGAVLNPLNTRLDPATIAFSLDHGEAKALIVDADCAALAGQALARLGRDLLVVAAGGAALPGAVAYEDLLAEGDPDHVPAGPADEWQSLCLLYTSGTTGDPKGAVYSHRGAYLQALGNALAFGLTPDSVYLWTLPMFHCNGWSYPWAIVAAGGTQVCLRKVEPAAIFRLIAAHGVTHLCGAPIVLSMIANAPPEERTPFAHTVRCATGGAAPPSTVLRSMEELGFRVTHLYGATESYGPATMCLAQPDWTELPAEQRYARMARQGAGLATLEAVRVADPASLEPVPQDGVTVGEICLRGNTVMKGYLKNPAATEAALGDGWYRSGDLAVWHADGAVEIKDRAKDIIISGGENISSLEVEEVLTQHPAVMLAAVVAKPDPTWGESPCAFLELKPGAAATAPEILDFCRARLARFKVPRTVLFGPLPKTSTGKIQKFVLRERARGDDPTSA